MKVVPSIAATRLCYEMIIGTSSSTTFMHATLLVLLSSVHVHRLIKGTRSLPQLAPHAICAA